jgi:hypothetical protein
MLAQYRGGKEFFRCEPEMAVDVFGRLGVGVSKPEPESNIADLDVTNKAIKQEREGGG